MKNIADTWFKHRGYTPHEFQKETWQAIAEGKSGLLNAPTGFGKTYAIWFGVLQNYYAQKKQPTGLHALWITPLRALSKEIALATRRVSEDLELDYTIELRTGDTSTTQRSKQKEKPPSALITTPESVHILFTNKNYKSFFKNLQFIIVDEWHELLGSKRGVQIELAIAHLKQINPNLIVWGISATIGNLLEAKDILLHGFNNTHTVTTQLEKKIDIHTLLPDTIENFSWAGHIGLQLLDKVIQIISTSNSTLIFTNTRGQSEIWYQRILEQCPDLAGQMALHHGSLSQDIRTWVENNLHTGTLKAVVATSSLDLGVDFHPVDTVIQIGSPKGIARVLQRAGRSGHQPHAVSKLYFLPTNTLEIIEGAAIKQAIKEKILEDRIPYINSFDVLVQYMVTLSIADGFNATELLQEVRSTHCYQYITDEEFAACLKFITVGGDSLGAYNEYKKVHLVGERYHTSSHSIARMHRMSMGTIVGDSMISVKFMGGKRIGQIEEYFVSKLKIGDTFWFGGQCLELVRIKDMEAHVKKAKSTKAMVPSYIGGRMPLSSQLGKSIRQQLDDYCNGKIEHEELAALDPVFTLQSQISHVPTAKQMLVETLVDKDGYHIFFYPFEGRFVHEGIAAILAYRIGKIIPASFSMAFNDYGFELLCEQEIDIDNLLQQKILSPEKLAEDVLNSMNALEMARRKFRDIACISGLVFTGYPGQQKRTKDLQASTQLFFNVYAQYEPENILYKQAFQEVLDFQLEITRMQEAFTRINEHQLVIQHLHKVSPFCFPLVVDNLRERMSTESLEARIERMIKKATS